jgi:hypothetical protein
MRRSSLLGLLAPALLVVGLLPDRAAAQSARSQLPPGFHAVVMAPQRNPALYGPIENWLNQSGMLTIMARSFSDLKPNRPVLVVAGECGQENAFFVPDDTLPRVVLCYEFVQAVIDEFKNDGLDQATLDTRIKSTVLFVLFHEFGHALIHLFDLPITGREEDAVDQLATFILAEKTPEAAYSAAEFFRQTGDWGDMGIFRRPHNFADEHSLDEQRFFNILCWTYGANPAERWLLAERLPRGRAQRCPAEWAQLKRSWDRIMLAALNTVSNGSAQPVRPEPAHKPNPFAGTWHYSESIADGLGLTQCSNTGTYTFLFGESTAGTYDQTGTCRLLGKDMPNNGSGALADIALVESRIHFSVDACRYSGQFEADALIGDVVCTISLAGKHTSLTGKWRATREGG